MIFEAWVRTVLILAGLGQIALIVASLAIPRVLEWPRELAGLKPLLRQMFWVYSAYIWGTNLSFGLLSTFAPGLLLDGSPLAGCVAAFIAVYWGARVVIQFAYFDRSGAPQGRIFVLAEVALVALFVALTLVYGGIAVGTLRR
jgi:hypothetical protein